MSLIIEMFILIALAGLIGGFLGWLLHGSCDEEHENTKVSMTNKTEKEGVLS